MLRTYTFVVTGAQCAIVGFLQLAGGTNAHTVDALKREGLFLSAVPEKDATIAGVAYGGYARKVHLFCGSICSAYFLI